jgi:hypothetical protein
MKGRVGMNKSVTLIELEVKNLISQGLDSWGDFIVDCWDDPPALETAMADINDLASLITAPDHIRLVRIRALFEHGLAPMIMDITQIEDLNRLHMPYLIEIKNEGKHIGYIRQESVDY